MNFLTPIYFWTLLGLLIPILIHLWNRKKIKTIKIGSVQLLKESNPKQARSIRLNEWVLLFLRMLMIGLLTFLLVEPVLIKTINHSKLTYIVEPEILLNKRFSAALDSLSFDEIRLLQTGFPILETETEINYFTRPNYWQLAQEMKELPADSIVVFTYGSTSGIKGIRPALPNRINWILVPTSENKKNYLSAQKKGDSIQLLSANSENQLLYFTKENISTSNKQIEMDAMGDSVLIRSGIQKKLILQPESKLEVAIIFEEETTETMQLCVASLNVMADYLDHNITIQSAKNYKELTKKNYDFTIHLSQMPIDITAQRMLIYSPDSTAQNLIIEGDDKTTFVLTKKLYTNEVIETHFPEKLWKIIRGDPALEKEIELVDGRQMDLTLLKPNVIQNETGLESIKKLSITPWLWGVFILIFTVERIISKKRRQ